MAPSETESKRAGASLIFAGTVLGFLAIALGAFGAHAIEHSLSEKAMGWWKTASAYHLPLSAATVTMGALTRVAFPGARNAGWLFVIGITVFSGSLYALALTDTRWLGAITPIGGVVIMAGWVSLAIGAWRARKA
jgi:uncharacterized membrane protein YgdD (TMEM256/DUF423 family)